MILGFNVPMWGYKYGYTAAQIELAVSDAPFVNYKRNDKDKKKFKKPDPVKTLQAQIEWEKRHREGKKHFSTENYNNNTNN